MNYTLIEELCDQNIEEFFVLGQLSLKKNFYPSDQEVFESSKQEVCLGGMINQIFSWGLIIGQWLFGERI